MRRRSSFSLPLVLVDPVVIVDDETHILESFSLILRSAGIGNVRAFDDSMGSCLFLMNKEWLPLFWTFSCPILPALNFSVK